MSETSKIGLVGFFDILGYQNILERNEPEIIAEEVLPILSGVGKQVTAELKKMIPLDASEANKEMAVSCVDTMSWLVFSDTILLTLPTGTSEDPKKLQIQWLTFLLAVIALQSKLFAAGLPARGAIEFGKFFVQGTCFAGRTIVDAYKLSNKIELAACVLANSAKDEYLRVCKIFSNNTTANHFDAFVTEYLVPMKQMEQHMLVVMAHTYNYKAPDIHATVMRAFWGNGKDISLSARPKAENTKQWLEFLENRRISKEPASQ